MITRLLKKLRWWLDWLDYQHREPQEDVSGAWAAMLAKEHDEIWPDKAAE